MRRARRQWRLEKQEKQYTGKPERLQSMRPREDGKVVVDVSEKVLVGTPKRLGGSGQTVLFWGKRYLWIEAACFEAYSLVSKHSSGGTFTYGQLLQFSMSKYERGNQCQMQKRPEALDQIYNDGRDCSETESAARLSQFTLSTSTHGGFS